MKRYNPKEIEPKWQQRWADEKIYQAADDADRPKKYVLEYFPYPSGAAMHVGHVRNYTIGDAVGRFARMRGYDVLHPMGWDAFGLPAENYAIKTGVSPQQAIAENTSKFKRQLMQMGFGYDWSREINSSDPEYYKWTQWFFLLLYRRGLAYRKESLQWWCPVDKTVLANEQVENGRCWRCDSEVEKKALPQWFFKITEYADRLAKDLDDVNWTDSIKNMQRNWIGRSKGAEINFKVADTDKTIKVFTTRPDTLYGATFMVLAPEHPLVKEITSDEQRAEVEEYVRQAQAKSDVERQETDREKTGVPTGAYAINPANDEKIPVWVADYVLYGYGTGAIMAVPAHDERDGEFAKKFNLPIRWVITAEHIDASNPPREGVEVVPRVAVQSIVKHPTEDKYLLLKQNGWETESYSYPTGGIDDGETPEDTAVRELKEETGFKNVKCVAAVAVPYYAQFYHEFKKVNRRVQMHTVEIQLADLQRDEVSAEEAALNEPLWVPVDEVMNKLSAQPSRDVFQQYRQGEQAMTFEGVMVNSGAYDGISSDEMREKIVADLETKGVGKERINYKIRDWLISRQRYWGAPIPIIHCEKCGTQPVPEDQLPVVLPEMKSFEPSGDGRSPLARVTEFVNTTCPKCGGKAERETDTMDGFACSSWYFLRFADPHNHEAPFSEEKVKYWLPVDDYIGGAEHAVMHLLYARFWTKVMQDEGLIDFGEPFKTLRNHGMILAPDGAKMSKSKGNTIEPDGLIEQGYGADAIRIMELFIGPWNQSANWSVEGMGGSFRFLQRVWAISQEYMNREENAEKADDIELKRTMHRAIHKVSKDLEEMGFNTAIAALMETVNDLYKLKLTVPFAAAPDTWKWAIETLVQLLAPFAPHITDELWEQLGHAESVHVSQWPEHDEKYLATDTITIVVQVNGKVRAQIEVAADVTEEQVLAAAKENDRIKQYLSGQSPKKTIYVPKKLVNIVI